MEELGYCKNCACLKLENGEWCCCRKVGDACAYTSMPSE